MNDEQRAGGADEFGGGGVGSGAQGGAAAGDRAGRLGGLLQDLLRTHGRRRTAELLGLSERTLQRAEQVEAGEQLSEQFLRALEDYEAKLPGSGALPTLGRETAEELADLRRRVHRLERVLPEDIGDLPGAVGELAASVEQLQQQVTARQRSMESAEGGEDGRQAASVGASAHAPTGGDTTRLPLRPYPQLVTAEAEPGERRFYGKAIPTIAAWRQVRARREQASNALGKLDRLRADERLLELELALVGEHGLTLPPAERPWDGLRRQSELRVLRQALGRVRRQRRWAQLRHWAWRLLTLGLVGRGSG